MTQSKCKWVRLGDYIEVRRENNSSLKYGIELIEGVNNSGEFQPTKALTDDINLKPYKVVKKGDIVYNPSRLNIGSLAYRVGEMCIVSHLYQVFHVKEKYCDILSAEYLTLYLRRSEFYRYVDYDNFGSQRAEYNLKKLGELLIPLPSLAEQQKVVNAWKALREIKEQNEAIAAPLMQVCQSYIQDLKHKYESVEIGQFIEESKETNTDNIYGDKDARGVNTNKEIQECKRIGESLSSYKIVNPNSIVFNANIKLTQTSEKFAVALYKSDKPCIVSNFYYVFQCDEAIILPEYLLLWISRAEFARYVKFMSCSSVRDRFSFDDMKNVKIPLPPLEVQQSIVNLYNCANEAKKIAEEADRMSREVCPALIQHVISH